MTPAQASSSCWNDGLVVRGPFSWKVMGSTLYALLGLGTTPPRTGGGPVSCMWPHMSEGFPGFRVVCGVEGIWLVNLTFIFTFAFPFTWACTFIVHTIDTCTFIIGYSCQSHVHVHTNVPIKSFVSRVSDEAERAAADEAEC